MTASSKSVGIACFRAMAMTVQQTTAQGCGTGNGRAEDSKSELMRKALREKGAPLTAKQLAQAADVRSALVSSLLKFDVESGRVRKMFNAEGVMVYEMVPQTQPSARIQEAVVLLQGAGYKVLSPHTTA